jgi:hypothetical protein
MARRLSAVTLFSALCAAAMLACTPESRSQAAAQEPPRTWAFELTLRAGDRPDEYVVFLIDPWPTLQLHTEKLSVVVKSNDGRNIVRSVPLDSTVKLPEYLGSMNVRWAGFRLDYDSLPPGMYTLLPSAQPGFATRTDGSLEALNITRAYALTIYVPPHPERMPVAGIGEQFIFLMGFGYNGHPAPTVVDDQGAPLRFEQVAARPLSYEGTASVTTGETGLQFNRLGGKHLTVIFPGFNDPRDVPGLYPLVEDRDSRQMNVDYAGRRIWTRGAPSAYCDVSCEFAPPDTELYVVGVYRTRGYAEDMAIRQSGGGYLEQPSSYRALDPLVVALRDRGGRGPRATAMPLPDEGPNAYATFSDAWDLERAYSLSSMTESHPDWPAATRNAIVAAKPKLGMTRDMIAWMLGYPSTYGTIAQLYKLDTWTFDGPPMTDMNYNFAFEFKNNRVAQCSPECTSRL